MTTAIQKEYENDFYAWTIHNAKLLRAGKVAEVDIENIAEEIECMGKSEKQQLMRRLVILIVHLLKWKFQPTRRGKSWELTIKTQRVDLKDLLEDSPSLKNELEKKFEHAYERAVLEAAKQTRLDESEFPKQPPFTLQDCFNSAYLPG